MPVQHSPVPVSAPTSRSIVHPRSHGAELKPSTPLKNASVPRPRAVSHAAEIWAKTSLQDTHDVIRTRMVKAFRDKDTERIWNRQRVRRFQSFERQALKRLRILNAATSLEDLMLNLGNRFHALRGDHKGQFAIAINRQWRICFEWDGEDAANVEITEYH